MLYGMYEIDSPLLSKRLVRTYSVIIVKNNFYVQTISTNQEI